MFERFTPEVRRVIVHSQQLARERGDGAIDAEHLQAALDGDDGALRGFDGDRTGAAADYGSGGAIPISPRARKALELSLRHALGNGDNYIGTEHLRSALEALPPQRDRRRRRLRRPFRI